MKSWKITVPASRTEAEHIQLHLGDDFFRAAEHADMLGGDVEADITLTPSGPAWRILMECRGKVRTVCDRCQGDMEMDVADEYEAPLLPSAGGEIPAGDDSDALYYDPTTGRADLLRPLADTLALSLGLTHVHEAGDCDPEIESALDRRELEANTPFAEALGSLAYPDDEKAEDSQALPDPK